MNSDYYSRIPMGLIIRNEISFICKTQDCQNHDTPHDLIDVNQTLIQQLQCFFHRCCLIAGEIQIIFSSIDTGVNWPAWVEKSHFFLILQLSGIEMRWERYVPVYWGAGYGGD